jgi:light-regulated signal transduction histidine kinase (bacteriophytochrome)
LNEQLQIANKELEAFSYSVSHDLRAPLRHIHGFTDLLSRHFADRLDDKGRHYLTTISESVRQMGVLIDELLVFSRMGRSDMRRSRVNVADLVNSVIYDLREEYDGRTIDWSVGALPEITADSSMLRLAIANLVSNAVKYTRPRQHAKIEIGHLPQNEETVFFVRDNGVGFDRKYVDRLFGVFQRLHPANEFEGTGIGLANVRRIIERHGGRTWAEGDLDKGATVYFSLPVTHDA